MNAVPTWPLPPTTSTDRMVVIPRPLSRGDARVQISTAPPGDEAHRRRRQRPDHAPIGLEGRDDELPAREAPLGAEPRPVPEDVARLGKGRAEGEVRLQPVHDLHPPPESQED